MEILEIERCKRCGKPLFNTDSKKEKIGKICKKHELKKIQKDQITIDIYLQIIPE